MEGLVTAAHHATRPDVPIPALDGLSPRAAAAQGRVAEVRALAPDDADADLRLALGLEP